MTTRSRSQGGTAIRRGSERITRRSQVTAAVSPLITDGEMTARMVVIRPKDIWNVKCIGLRLGPSSYKEEEAVDFSKNDEDEEFLMDPDNVMLAHVEV